MITFEDIVKANTLIETMDFRGKDYCPVNQRIKAFRSICPNGFIHTEMVSNDNGICVFRAEVGYFEDDKIRHILGTGTAFEKESSSNVNKTSYIENCETSAVGRALGMAGFGIDASIASAEEVQNAILNQEKTAPKTAKTTSKTASTTPKKAAADEKPEAETTENEPKEPPYVDKKRLEDLIKVAELYGYSAEKMTAGVKKRFGKTPFELTEDEYKTVYNGFLGYKNEQEGA